VCCMKMNLHQSQRTTHFLVNVMSWFKFITTVVNAHSFLVMMTFTFLGFFLLELSNLFLCL
jgi:hypothetical protein